MHYVNALQDSESERLGADSWVSQAREHWQEFQPTRYQELEEAEILEQLEQQGFQQHEAWIVAREKYLILPEETTPDDEVNELVELSLEANRILNDLLRDPDQGS